MQQCLAFRNLMIIIHLTITTELYIEMQTALDMQNLMRYKLMDKCRNYHLQLSCTKDPVLIHNRSYQKQIQNNDNRFVQSLELLYKTIITQSY